MGKCKDSAACRPWKVQQVTSLAVDGECSFDARECKEMTFSFYYWINRVEEEISELMKRIVHPF